MARMHRNAMLAAAAVAVLLALPASAAATERTAEPRIVGGLQSARPWPAQGALEIDGNFGCGGTLLSGRWFLTAAHCVTNRVGGVLGAAAFKVRLGSSNRTQAPLISVASVIRHASYNPSTDENDVALLRLSSAPPATSATIQPLRIVGAGETGLWKPGTRAAIVGWGSTCSETCSTTTNLREAGVPITSDSACASAYPPGYFFADSMVCAGNGITDTCQGDSGGPIMVPRVDVWVLVGATSFGFGCADPDYPGVYARLGAPSLNAWVRDRIPTITISPTGLDVPRPGAGTDVTLRATGNPGQHTEPQPAFKWDLDADGAFDDATGPTAHLNPIGAGSHVVKVQQIYPADNDRAVAREVITTAGSAPPGPPAPAPIVGPPAPAPQPAPAPAPPAAPAPPPPPPQATPRLAELVSLPKRIKLSSLLDRRMIVRVRCRAACLVESTLRLDASTSRRLGFTRRKGQAKRIGAGDAERLSAGTLRVTIRLSRRTVKRLRRARRGTLTLRVSATDDDERRERITRTIKLRR